jgi:hypothetical protein
MDLLGQLFWIAIFLTPVLTIPLAWRLMDVRKVYRLLTGILLAVILSIILYFISLAIILRDGLGQVKETPKI